MEAMSAGLVCVHPNFGALYETSANWTAMYQYDEDINNHAHLFYNILDAVIENYGDRNVQGRVAAQKNYADAFYSWDVRAVQWESFLASLLNEPRELPVETPSFVYKT